MTITFLTYSEKIQMLHDFINVDKSPLVNFAKGGFKKASLLLVLAIISTSFTTGVIPVQVAGVSNTPVAEASEFEFIWKALVNNGGNIYGLINAGRIRQLYLATDGGYVARQFGTGSAGYGKLHDMCSNNYASRVGLTNGEWWVFWSSGRWVVVVARFENGIGNCYYRRLVR
jgi:hypothetical protein